MRKSKPKSITLKPLPPGGHSWPRPGLEFGPVRLKGHPKVLPVPGAIAGLDLSFYQPKVDWAAVLAEGMQFCIAKASDGVGSKDSMFETHRKNATANGLIFGAYHFLRFGGLNAKDEAAFFIKATGGVRAGELPLTLDIEWDRKNAKYNESHEKLDEAGALEALEMLERLEDATQLTPIVYCSWPFFEGIKNPERFFRFLPWNPAYRVDGPGVPPPWSSWAFWQWTDKHPAAKKIVGSVNLDGDYFNGTLTQLRALCK